MKTFLYSLVLIAAIALAPSDARRGGRGPPRGGKNVTFVNVTCDADAPPPITCGLYGNATGILACRPRNGKRFGRSRGGRGRGLSNSTTICVDPEQGRDGDTCGCCDGDSSCPTEPCGCPCDIIDRLTGSVIGTGVNITFIDGPRGRFGRGKRRRGGRGSRGRGRRTSICVSPEDSVTLRLSGRLECVPSTAEACPQGGF